MNQLNKCNCAGCVQRRMWEAKSKRWMNELMTKQTILSLERELGINTNFKGFIKRYEHGKEN